MSVVPARRLRIGIAGAGAIGSAVVRALDRRDAGADVVAVATRTPARARERWGTLSREPEFADFDELAERCDVVVEALPTACFRQAAIPAIERGKVLLALSSGALLEHEDLIARARQTGARIIVPSGALLGLDAVRAAAEGTIHSATIVTRKPPAGLAGAPYLAEHGIELRGITAAVKVFDGSARDGAKHFPANVNVAATLSLAGIGADRTRLQIWADPTLERNTHHVEIDADSARFSMTVEGIPSAENPRTGKLTPLSVVATIRALASTLRVGS